MTATSVVPPPMSTIMLPPGSSMGRPAPMAAAMGSSMRYTSRAPACMAESRPARFSTRGMPCWQAVDETGAHQGASPRDRVYEVVEHLLRHVKIGDDAILERPDGHDAPRGPPQHRLGLPADRQYRMVRLVNGHDGRLVEH